MADQTIALQVQQPDFIGGLAKVAQIQNTQANTQRTRYDQMSEEMGRAAKDIMMQPEGPERTQRWNHYVDQFHKQGYLTDNEKDQWYNKPSNLVLNQAIAHATHVPTQMGMTGQTAGLSAAAQAPYQHITTGKDSATYMQGTLPGSPTPLSPPSGMIPDGDPRASPSPLARVGGAGAPVAPRGPGSGAPAATGAASAAPSTAAPPSPASAPTPSATNIDPRDMPKPPPVRTRSPEDEIPKLEPPAAKFADRFSLAKGADAGKTEAEIEADKAALQRFDVDIRKVGTAANELRAGYGTLRSLLESGDLDTSRLGPLRQTVASWAYAAGLGEKDIHKMFGWDPAKGEVMSKESVKLSTQAIKDTIGAGESLAAIQAVMQAFPNAANTREANLALVDTLDATARWKEDKAKYALAWVNKNPDIPPRQSLSEFDKWWKENHSQQSYISRIIPNTAPMVERTTASGGVRKVPDVSRMEPNVTYKVTGPDGKSAAYFVYDPSEQPPLREADRSRIRIK